MDYADGVQISGLIMLANLALDAWRQILVQIDKMVSWRLILQVWFLLKRKILRVPMILISLFYPAMFIPNKGIDFLFCWL